MYQSLLNEDYAYQQSSRRMSHGDHISSSSHGSISSRENSPYSGDLEYYGPSLASQNYKYNCHYQSHQVTVNSFDNLYGASGFDDVLQYPSKGNMVHHGIMHQNPMTDTPITVKNHGTSPVTTPVTTRYLSLPALSPMADQYTSATPVVPSQLPICNGDLYQNFMMFSPLQQEQHQYRPAPITRHISPCISKEGSVSPIAASSVSSEEFTRGSLPEYALQQLLQLLPDNEIRKETQSSIMKTSNIGRGKSIRNKTTRVKRDEVNIGITKSRKSNSCHQQDGAKQFLCSGEGCGKVFRRSEHLKRHIRSIHTKEKRKYFIQLYKVIL